MGRIQPKLNVLTPDQIQQIHQYSLQILGKTGLRVDSPQARALFAQATGQAAGESGQVRIPAELVEWALSTAPERIRIFDRRGNPAFMLGEDRTRFGIGVTSLYYQDPHSDAIAPFSRQNMREMVRLGQALPNYDVISTVGILQDKPPEVADLYAALEMVANTIKPLVMLVSDERLFPDVLDLLEHLHGDLAQKPFILPYFNPVTPLVINTGTSDKLIQAIQRGLPVIYSNYSMAGMSTPITAAGTLALMNAELLGGLVLSQLVKQGAPVILGMLPAFFDMKTMANFYDSQSMVINLACAEMMAHYGLPHCGTSGSGMGWGPDLLGAEMYWMNHLTSVLGKSGLAPFVGDTLGSKAFSPVNVVYAHEIIAHVLRLADGFILDDERVGLEEIEQVGPGGNFLRSGLTQKLFRQAYYSSPFFPNYSLEKWQAEGEPKAIERLRQYTLDLLEDVAPPEDYEGVMARGELFIKSQT
ncbi:MAG: trimethylamine methyltransferase family protein [Anaerolineales bacterium]